MPLTARINPCPSLNPQRFSAACEVGSYSKSQRFSLGFESLARVAVARRLQHGFRMTLLNFAVMTAVCEIDDQADHQPYNESNPRGILQAVHHVRRGNDSHNGSKRNPWCDKGALDRRSTFTQNPDSGAHDDERQQRAD